MHRCQHAVPFLWRFHALHHSDLDVDVATSVRHHPIEYLIAAGVYWLAVVALGIPATVVFGHALAVFAAALTHGKISLPEWLERLLRPVVITLDLHLVHHSISYDEQNANFGAVFSFWDRLFGTLSDFLARAAGPDRLRRPQVAAARLPEAFRDAADPLADRSSHSRRLSHMLPGGASACLAALLIWSEIHRGYVRPLRGFRLSATLRQPSSPQPLHAESNVILGKRAEAA
jgi:hypothetical protein